MFTTIALDVNKNYKIICAISSHTTSAHTLEQLSKIETADVFHALFFNPFTPQHIKTKIAKCAPTVTDPLALSPGYIEIYTEPRKAKIDLTLEFESLPIDLACNILCNNIKDTDVISSLVNQTDNIDFINAIIENPFTSKSIRELIINKYSSSLLFYKLIDNLIKMPLNTVSIRMMILKELEKNLSQNFIKILEQEEITSDDLMVITNSLSKCCNHSDARAIAVALISHPKCNSDIFNKAAMYI